MKLLANPLARRAAYEPTLHAVMNIDAARAARAALAGWTRLNRGPTPLWSLRHLAARWGLTGIDVKDESLRSPLASFKVLGAPFALLRWVRRQRPELAATPQELLDGRRAAALRDLVVISATDGNHGRALAAAAQSVGCRCVIVLHAHVSPEREAPIAALGAEIVRVAGNYDASVHEAARLAAANGWQVVSDTSYAGYEAIPRDVMQGYAAIVDELFELEPPVGWTHVIVQGGVGGLAAGIASYFCERLGDRRPHFIVVEPEQADCLWQSARAGVPAAASGSVDSVMAGLACGETSPLAWRFLAPAVDHFMTIDDDAAVAAMRLLASGAAGDVPVLSGESGAAGLAALTALAATPTLRTQVGLDANSRVLLINTEGATAPALYEQLVGRSAASVVAAQAQWLAERSGR